MHSFRAQLSLREGVHMSIGTRMRAFRESLGLSREKFGEQFEISPSTLSGYERELREPHADGLLVFAKAGANLHWLVTGVGEMEAPTNLNKTDAAEAGGQAMGPGMLYPQGGMSAPLQACVSTTLPFNLNAYKAILVGILNAGAPPEKAVDAAFEFYEINVKRGLINPVGGSAPGKNAA